MKTLLTTLNAKYIHSSLALFSLKAFCEKNGQEICLKEYTVNNGILDVLGEIYELKPDVIGLACYIWNIEMTLELTALIRKVLPQSLIILGGPEVSYDGKTIMLASPEIDYIIQGEGEETLSQLLTCLREKRDVGTIAGILYRRNGEVCSLEGAQVVQELSFIPFAYQDEDMTALQDKIIYYESSRGCPFSCQYCLSSATQGVRFLPLDRVISELLFFIHHKVKQVKFVDRTFNARKEHYLPIIKFLAEAECRTNFHFEIAADILDEETLDVLISSPPGRFQLEIGIQSTHEPTLAEIRRTNNWPRIVRNVKVLRSCSSIHLHLDLIAGLPKEDYYRFGQSFDDVFALRPHMLQMGFLKLLKGSGISGRVAEDEYLFMDKAPYEVLANKYITYGEIHLLKIIEEVLNQTYNTGRFLGTTEWMIDQIGGAFAFFVDFSLFWQKHQLHSVSHNAKSIYLYFADYCREKGWDQKVCFELLKFDALSADKGMNRPDFLPWDEAKWDEAKSNFFRDETAAGRYIPGYRFTNWRQIKRQYHIEFFDYDLTSPEGATKKQTAYLFVYGEPTVRVQRLELSEFHR